MAYCSVGNVTGSFKRISLDATSDPTRDEVVVYCDEISLEMDARIQTLGITVPITSTDEVKTLRKIAVNGVIAQILRSVEMEVESATMYQNLYDKKMKNIVESPGMLDTVISEDSPGFQEERQDRNFKMGEKAW